jgi:hypothetical protein
VPVKKVRTLQDITGADLFGEGLELSNGVVLGDGTVYIPKGTECDVLQVQPHGSALVRNPLSHDAWYLRPEMFEVVE